MRVFNMEQIFRTLKLGQDLDMGGILDKLQGFYLQRRANFGEAKGFVFWCFVAAFKLIKDLRFTFVEENPDLLFAEKGKAWEAINEKL